MKLRVLSAVLMVATGACATDPPVTDPPGAVAIVVTRDGVPVAGASVVFSGTGGELLATATTDDAGRAAAALADAVTVVDPATPTHLLTVMQIRSADPIEIPLAAATDPAPTTGTLTVEAPPGATPAGTDHYLIETACGSFGVASLPATVSIAAACRVAAGVPVLVTAATPEGSLEDPGHTLAFVAGFATGTTDVTLTPGAWSTTCAQVAVRTQPLMSVQIWPRFGGVPFVHTAPGFCTPTTVPTGFTAYPVLDFGEGATAFTFGYVTGSLRMAELASSFAALPPTLDIASDRDLLVGDVDLTAMDGRGAAWSRDPSLADTDAIVADLDWSLTSSTYLTWRFVLPGDATSVALPALPASIATWPSLDAATDHIAELRYLDASWLSSLPEVHAALPTLLAPVPPAGQPADGSVRSYVEQFYPDAGP